MVHAMKTANSKIVFTLPSCLDIATQAAKIAGLDKERIVLLEGTVKGIRDLQSLIDDGKHLKRVSTWNIPAGKTNKDICGYVFFFQSLMWCANRVTVSNNFDEYRSDISY